MTNLELIKAFGRGAKKGNSGGKKYNNEYNLRIVGDLLYNYSTIIAIRGADNEIVLNAKKYSRTTSIIQNNIRYYTNVVKEVLPEELYIEMYKLGYEV